MDGKSICPICVGESAGDDTDIVMTSCGHIFHNQCIENWKKSSPLCPICRHEFEDLKKVFPQCKFKEEFEKCKNELQKLEELVEEYKDVVEEQTAKLEENVDNIEVLNELNEDMDELAEDIDQSANFIHRLLSEHLRSHSEY